MDSDAATPINDDFAAGAQQGIDWQACFHAVRERLWIVVLCLVLGAMATTAFLLNQRQQFQARSVLFIEQEQSRVLDKVQGVGQEQILSLDMINTVVDLIRSYPFAQRVAARLNLQKDPRFLRGLLEKPTGELTSDDAAAYLAQSVTASYRPRTRLIDIFVTQADNTLATELANAYAEEYLRYGVDRRAEANKAANQFLLDEEVRLRKEVRRSEEAMQVFRERERSTSLERLEQGVESKVAEITKNINDLETRLVQLDTDLKEASATPNDAEALLRLPSVAAQPKVAEINQTLAESERQFTLLKQTYRAKHPLYIAAQTGIDTLRRNRNQVLQDVVTLLRGEKDRIQAQHDELVKARDAQQGQLVSYSGKSVEYNDLKRALDTNTAMHNNIGTRLAEIDVTKGLTDSQVRVHERAVGAAPLRASAVKVSLLGVLGGIVAGLGIALALHFLDRSVKTVDQAEDIAGLPVISAIPKRTHGRHQLLDVVNEREGMVAEGFRSLRTSLAMASHTEERRSFLFTSAQPAEGKTFCSTNFAATLCQQGFRTLLIDADLRRPMVSRVFFNANRQPGLSEVLLGKTELADAIIRTEVPDLAILSAGGRVANPAEILATARMREVLSEALLTFDRVVIDTAPALAVSDSLLLAPHVDVTCLVLRSFKTPRKTFARAIKALADIDCRPVGVVLNFLPSGLGTYYYYSGRYYGSYGEKGVYGT